MPPARLCALALVACLGLAGAARAQALPAGLVDQRGAAFPEGALAGRLRLLYFGYTHCPDLCPTTLDTLSWALDLLPPPAAERVAPVLVAADPARDTAPVLREYLASFHPRIVGVTGPVAAIDDLAWSLGALIVRHPDGGAAGYTVDHTTDLFLIRPEGGRPERVPHGTDAEALAVRIRAALGEAGMR
ncbi:SCO family protein [Methylobacterium durans]|uniref:SCO family protein n=1 Tax=Methylobacterium durans TaxID=2202825 RepID=UPI002AFFE235|nr:SCO family protein [Methylobacterium durans]MEA1832122.1 SCO family protein [Methylobacterium durans]